MLALLGFSMLAGWCGSEVRRVRLPLKPQPVPWWVSYTVVPAAASVLTVLAFTQTFGSGSELSRLDALLSLAPGFLVGAAVGSLLDRRAPLAT